MPRVMPETVGQRYQLRHRIGEDEYSETWEAFDARLDRQVTLRLLAPELRDDLAAQAYLRRAARAPAPGAGFDAPRMLDGGDDPTYGPFVVSELSRSLQPTQPITTLDPPRAVARPTRAEDVESAARPAVPEPARRAEAWAAQPLPRRRAMAVGERRGAGILALVVLGLVVVAAIVFVLRAFAPAAQSTAPVVAMPTPGQPARPLSGAPAEQPTARPTAVPTRAAPEPAAVAPTALAAVVPTPTVAEPMAVTPTVQPTLSPTRQATPQPTPRATAPVQASASGSPVDTIRQHYALINARRYADGYTLMDAHLRSLNSPADYAGWFANKVAIEPISVELVSQTDAQAIVRSVVQTTDRVNDQDVTSQVSERFVLQQEDGAWRIDQVSRI